MSSLVYCIDCIVLYNINWLSILANSQCQLWKGGGGDLKHPYMICFLPYPTYIQYVRPYVHLCKYVFLTFYEWYCSKYILFIPFLKIILGGGAPTYGVQSRHGYFEKSKQLLIVRSVVHKSMHAYILPQATDSNTLRTSWYISTYGSSRQLQ